MVAGPLFDPAHAKPHSKRTPRKQLRLFADRDGLASLATALRALVGLLAYAVPVLAIAAKKAYDSGDKTEGDILAAKAFFYGAWAVVAAIDTVTQFVPIAGQIVKLLGLVFSIGAYVTDIVGAVIKKEIDYDKKFNFEFNQTRDHIIKNVIPEISEFARDEGYSLLNYEYDSSVLNSSRHADEYERPGLYRSELIEEAPGLEAAYARLADFAGIPFDSDAFNDDPVGYAKNLLGSSELLNRVAANDGQLPEVVGDIKGLYHVGKPAGTHLSGTPLADFGKGTPGPDYFEGSYGNDIFRNLGPANPHHAAPTAGKRVDGDESYGGPGSDTVSLAPPVQEDIGSYGQDWKTFSDNATAVIYGDKTWSDPKEWYALSVQKFELPFLDRDVAYQAARNNSDQMSCSKTVSLKKA